MFLGKLMVDHNCGIESDDEPVNTHLELFIFSNSFMKVFWVANLGYLGNFVMHLILYDC
jgi:hypothetical protein